MAGERNSGRFPVKRAVINVATITTHTIVAAVPGKKIIVLGYMLRGANAQTVQWRSGPTTPLMGVVTLTTSDLALADRDNDNGVMETAVGEALSLVLTAATQVSGNVTYIEV